MIYEKVTFKYPNCFLYRHYMGEEKCKAYPDGIPENILEELSGGKWRRGFSRMA